MLRIFHFLFLFSCLLVLAEKKSDFSSVNHLKLTQEKIPNRDSLRKNIQTKIRTKKPLVIHAIVPLCDNDHQGIVPVNSQLGDGQNLKTNLYWGAGYGVKSYFKLKTDWKLSADIMNPHTDILERVVFKKTLSNGTKLILVADAFRGDRMKESLHSYFASLSGIKNDSVIISSTESFKISSEADLLIFNGHDGLMDDTLKTYFNKDGKQRETMVIACYGKTFFLDRIEKCGAYPLITTTGLLAPEAYAMHAGIEAWAQLKSDKEIRNAVGDAYFSKHPSSTQAGCRGLFYTGW